MNVKIDIIKPPKDEIGFSWYKVKDQLISPLVELIEIIVSLKITIKFLLWILIGVFKISLKDFCHIIFPWISKLINVPSEKPTKKELFILANEVA